MNQDNQTCCEYHDNLSMADKNIEFDECGIAGPGNVLLCCEDCPERKWYEVNQRTRGIDYAR